MADQPIQTTFKADDQLTPAIQTMLRALTGLNAKVDETGKVFNALGQEVTGRAAEALKRLASENASATQGMRQASQAATEQGRALQGLELSTSSVTRALQAFGVSLSVAGLAQLTKEIYAIGIAYDNLRGGLTAATGGMQAGAVAFEQVRRVSDQTGTDLQKLAKGFIDLSAAAQGTVITQAQIAEGFELIANRVRGLGGSPEQVKSVLDAVAKELQQPEVTFQQLRRAFAINLPGALEIFAKAYNTTLEGLKRKLAEGEIDGADFYTHLVQYLEKTASASEDLSKRMGVGFNQVKNTWNELLDAIANTSVFQRFETNLARSLQQVKAIITTGDPLAGFKLGQAGQTAPGAATGPYADLMNKYAAQYGVDPRLVQTVYGLEGSKGDVNARSPKGALGLMQVLPSTGAEVGFSEAQLRTAEGNIEAGIKYIAKLQTTYGMGGDVQKILAAYNAGPGHKGIPLPGENQQYVVKGMAAYQALGGSPTFQVGMPSPSLASPGVAPGTGSASGSAFTPETEAAAKLKRATDNADDFTEALARGDKALRDLDQAAKDIPQVVGTPLGDAGDRAKFLQAQVAALIASLTEAEKLAARRERQGLGPLPSEAQAARTAQQTRLAALQGQTEIEDEQRKLRQERWKNLDIFGITLDAEQERDLKEQAKAQHERIKEFVEQLNLFGLIHEPEQERAQKAQEEYDKLLGQALARLQAPVDERASAGLRARAPGGITSAAEETKLALIDATDKARQQAKDLEGIYRGVGQGIEQSLTSAFEAGFGNGEVSGKQFGLSLLQGLQRTFSQLTTALINQALNVSTGSSQSTGGWAGVLAHILVKAVGAYAGSGGDFSAAGPSDTGGGGSFGATGGIMPAIQSLASAGMRLRRTSAAMQPLHKAFGELQPVAMAAGGIVRQPSFAILSEKNTRQFEAVVPLPDNRSIPVTLSERSGSSQGHEPQPIVINIMQDYSGSIDPRSLRTQPAEIRAVVASDISNDGSLRRVILRHATR